MSQYVEAFLVPVEADQRIALGPQDEQPNRAFVAFRHAESAGERLGHGRER